MVLVCVFLFILYLIEFYTGLYFLTNPNCSIIIYITLSVLFFKRERKKSVVCPEIFIFPIFFVCIFYKELVIDNVSVLSIIYNQFTDVQYCRGRCVNMIAFISLLIGELLVRKETLTQTLRGLKINKTIYNYELLQMFYIASILFCMFSFLTGKMSVINKYVVDGGQNTYLVYNTITLFICTILEFSRLSEKGVANFKELIKYSNKIYLCFVILFGALLLVTGNRGESMLILMPCIFSFSYLIKGIKAKQLVLLILIGFPIMVILSYTRVGDTFDITQFEFLDSFRDYGPSYLTETGLIVYTDNHGYNGLGLGFRVLLSSIPFLGGMIQAIIPSSYTHSDNSAILATDMFQLKNNMDSGLGTSLIGDLYYSGGIVWVIVYMILLGYFLSYCYKRIYIERVIGVYSFMTYIWIGSNSLYILRAEWYSMFRYIGFSFVILFILRIIYKSSKSTNHYIK